MARIGFALSRGLPPRDIVDCVRVADELGYESAWVAEGHGGDQFAILSACAAVTKRILLGTSISSVFVRTVPTIAMAAATVDHLSQQRFILGLGSSHRVQVEPEHGVPYGKPIQRLRESVEVIRTLLRDGVVSYKGGLVTIERFDLWFTPTRQEIPIYLAALFPKMLQVCGEIAQGVILTWSTLDAGRRAAENIAIGARRAGRRPEEVDITSLLPCHVTNDRRRAFDAMRPAVAFYGGFFPRYNRLMAESGFPEAARAIKAAWDQGGHEAAARAVPDALIEAIAVVGTPAECRDRVEAYRRSGIALPIISPRPTGAD
ncbi:MAG: LLM class flavin-dependent oxidoreductase, partial [Candidatus Tectomicrobia bacterium]|nr:LLM class flavin-dependent oxidoreductase [Candidatus Tectomicrobia bacterium]